MQDSYAGTVMRTLFAALPLIHVATGSASAQTGFTHPNAVYTATDYLGALIFGSPQFWQGGVTPQPWGMGFEQFVQAVETENNAPMEGLCPVPAKFNLEPVTNCSIWVSKWHDASKEVLFSGYATQALYNALRWLQWDGPENDPLREAHRQRAIALIDLWTRVPIAPETSWGESAFCASHDPPWDAARCEVESYLGMVFRAPAFLLAADVLLSQGPWDAVRYNRFVNWLDGTLRNAAERTAASNLNEWPPYGQNHRPWAIFNLLLRAHLKHDVASYNTWKSQLIYYIENRIMRNGAQPAELIRGDQAHQFSVLNLEAVVAAAKLVANHGGPDLFSDSSLAAQRLRAAVQHVLWFEKHPDAYPAYYLTTVRGSLQARAAALIEPLAGYYVNTEIAEFCHCYQPNDGFSPGHTWTTMMYSVLAPPVNLSQQERLPLHQFNGDRNDFVAARGNWREELDAPSDNRVYRQYNRDNVDATAIAGDAGWLDYEVSARFKVRSFNPSNLASVGIVARYVDNDNYYRFHFHRNTNSLRIEQKVGGAFVFLQSIPVTLNVGNWYAIRVKINGPQMRVTVSNVVGGANGTEGTVVGQTFSDNAVSSPLSLATGGALLQTRLRQELVWSGKVGLFAHQTDVMFDNVVVRRIPFAEAGTQCAE